MIGKPVETIMEKAQVHDSGKTGVYSNDYEPPQPKQAMVLVLASDQEEARKFATALAGRLGIEPGPVAGNPDQYRELAGLSRQVAVLSPSLAAMGLSPAPGEIGTSIYLTSGPMAMDPAVMAVSSHIVHGDRPMEEALDDAEEKVRTTLSDAYGI